MIAVIMQPTYLPWMGYFDLMAQSDIFIFLDNVQFEKQSWQQRNKIKTSQGWQWLTVSVVQKISQKIDEVEINNKVKWREKHWKTIMQNYRKSEFWSTYSSFFEDVYQREWKYLANLNIHITGWIRDQLGIETRLKSASEMDVQGQKVSLVIDICKKVGADTYLSPIGAKEYIEGDNRFADEGIRLQYHDFEHPVYRQLYGDFIPYMSVIDLLFNEGPRSLEIIRSGRR